MSHACSDCGAVHPADRLDLTAHGYRCARCSQAAAIHGHLEDRQQKLRAHNRRVAFGAGFKFWRVDFRCSECHAWLPKDPGLLSLRLAPPTVACGGCSTAFATSFLHRANWQLAVLLKVAFVVCLVVRHQDVRSAVAGGEPVEMFIELVIAFLIAFPIAAILAVPAALLGSRRSPT